MSEVEFAATLRISVSQVEFASTLRISVSQVEFAATLRSACLNNTARGLTRKMCVCVLGVVRLGVKFAAALRSAVLTTLHMNVDTRCVRAWYCVVRR